jgi:hypothetical protein
MNKAGAAFVTCRRSDGGLARNWRVYRFVLPFFLRLRAGQGVVEKPLDRNPEQ